LRLWLKKTIPKKIEREIFEYVANLKKDRLPIKKVILFGSYAKGAQHKWSDIDICVVSPKFKNTFSAMQYLWLKRINDQGHAIEPVGFSPKDYKEGSSLINEIKQTGIEIKI